VSHELLVIGASAPGFEAAADNGSRYDLASLLPLGPVVLYFYPGNNTPG
jgi:peroxiredoxin